MRLPGPRYSPGHHRQQQHRQGWNQFGITGIFLCWKIRLMGSLVTSISMYACESWTLTAESWRRIQAMEMRCYRKILRISYKDHDTNEEFHAKIQQAIGQHEDLLITVKRRKMQLYGLVSRSSVWPKPSCKAQCKREEDKGDRGRGGKTTSGSGQAWSSLSLRGLWRTGKNGEKWLWNHLWCTNDPKMMMMIDPDLLTYVFRHTDLPLLCRLIF